jgi:hypothetical protein
MSTKIQFSRAGGVSTHKILSASHLDALAADVVAGDILYGNATPAWARLAKGNNDQVLMLSGGYPAWSDLPAGAAHAILSATHSDTLAAAVARGSLIYGNSTPKWASLAIGAADRLLKSDGTDVSWAQLSAGMIPSSLITTNKLAQVPACRLRHSADQNLTSGVWLASLFDTEDFDNDNMHSTVANTDGITINTAGIYLVGGHAAIESNATNSFRWLEIYKNGADHLLLVNEWSQGATLHTWMHTDGILQLAAGDYLQFRAIQTSGSTLKLFYSAGLTPMFYAVRLSA